MIVCDHRLSAGPAWSLGIVGFTQCVGVDGESLRTILGLILHLVCVCICFVGVV